ncbi:MAG: CCA tRNA nucleotidyltransferase, partial [Deltaproteobacteria bacterium]|nr:CCA tRNA nucleotidyltransferase [Deltaproteobacteria bacterium]
AGHVAYFAGGCVRDHLLGRPPVGDFDVATSARPEAVQRLFPRTVAVGAQFGVILVLHDDVRVEVATFRADEAYVDGRHPVAVRFTTPEEDAARRDFTINGMFADPFTWQVHDFVGGREDLARRLVRAIGDPRRRFDEDKLRLVRAVRFAARLGFAIDAETASAVREMAAELHAVSAERIGEEIVKILGEGGARRGFELLSALGLLREVLPEIEAMRGVEQGKEFHPEGDVFTHTMLALGLVDESPMRGETLAFGVLLHDVAKRECAGRRDGKITFYGHCERGAAMAREICRRLRRPNAVAERVAWLVKNHLRVLDAPQMRLATLKRFLREEGIAELLELCRIDASASNGNLQFYEFCRARLAAFSAADIQAPPLVSGDDLIALGHRPGPAFRTILEAVEDAQLEGALVTREQALEFVRERFPLEV